MTSNLTISREYADTKKGLSDVEVWIRHMLNNKCEFNLKGLITKRNIYDYMCTSLSSYEKEVMNNELNKVQTSLSNKSVSVERTLSVNNYFIVDSTFPLYRGLLCMRETYSASKGIEKRITTQEINLYKNVIQLIYIYDKSGHLYNDSLVRQLYTEFEYEILLPELLAALCLDIITDGEFGMLLELLGKDPIVKIYLDNIKKICLSVYGNPKSDNLNSSYLQFTYSDNEIFKGFLKEVICIMLNPVYKLVIDSCRNITGINIKSVSDFRIIFELSIGYDIVEIELNTYNSKDHKSSIQIKSQDCLKQIKDMDRLLTEHRKGVSVC